MATINLDSRGFGVNVKNSITLAEVRELKGYRVRDLFREYTVNRARAEEVLQQLRGRQHGRQQQY